MGNSDRKRNSALKHNINRQALPEEMLKAILARHYERWCIDSEKRLLSDAVARGRKIAELRAVSNSLS